MKITYKKKIKWNINTIPELNTFILDTNMVGSNFKELPMEVHFDILSDIALIDVIAYKTFHRTVLNKYINETSSLRIEFYLQRGWNEDEAIECIKIRQSNNAYSRFVIENKNKNKYSYRYNTNIEYYTNKGVSVEEAKRKLFERQNTYGRSKLTKLYGMKIADEMIRIRNKKWIHSLESNNDMDNINHQRGNNGLTSIRTLTQYMDYYGELIGKIKFANRYWGISTSTLNEWQNLHDKIHTKYTAKFRDSSFRYQILTEQHNICAECNVHNSKALFHLHHIDYDKKNDNRENLIFLCHSCHSKTVNNNRSHWKEYYSIKQKEIINES